MSTQKNIKPPSKLYDHFEKYKKHCKENPKKENLYSQKLEREVSISREVPYTWAGFEVWLRANKILAKLDDYISNKDDRYADYAAILHAIGLEIYNDKFNGATAGIFQHNIIARDLGLVDKVEKSGKTEVKSTVIYIPDDNQNG